MVSKTRSINLSAVKSGISEIVRNVRRTGQSVVITVDGEPAARILPIDAPPRHLSVSERATVRALMNALVRIPRPNDPFNAATLVADGRR